MPRTEPEPSRRRRRRRLAAAIALALVFAAALAAPALAYAQARAQEAEPQDAEAAQVTKSPNDPSSGELVEEPKRYDGENVTFTGEAIGEALERGEMAWLHLNDDAYYLRNIEEGARLGGYNSGMPVWIARSLTEEIEFYGDYRHEGDVVTIQGVYNAACAEHGGDMDIHARTLEVDRPGHPVDDPIHPNKIIAVVALVPLGLLLWWLDGMLTTATPGRGRGRRVPRRARA